MSKNELTAVPLKPGAYEKPERKNANIDSRKYDKIDRACGTTLIASDGNPYLPEESLPDLLNKSRKTARYVADNMIPEEGKRTINNRPMINTSELVGYMDRNSHQSRDAEEAELNRYGRDSLTAIGDSDQAEAERRKIDVHVKKELPKLRKQRGTDFDEITGEPLRAGAAFHHSNVKSLYNDPLDVLDPDKGINVNPETHTEIHRRDLLDQHSLEKDIDAIRETVTKKR